MNQVLFAVLSFSGSLASIVNTPDHIKYVLNDNA